VKENTLNEIDILRDVSCKLNLAKIPFQRRKEVEVEGFKTTVISIEDLILFKLIWSRETRSEIQSRDIRNLLQIDHDPDYLNNWVKKLNLDTRWSEVQHG
jgi:hypothetical protein